MLMPMLDAVKPMDTEGKALAEERRLTLVAAIERTLGPVVDGAQSELHRRLVDSGERFLALQTVNKWCRGKSPMTAMTLRGVLTVLGVPPTWKKGDPLPPGWRLPSRSS